MITASDTLTFALSNRFFSYVLRVSDAGLLEQVYYGDPLDAPLNAPVHQRCVERGAMTDFEGRSDYNLNVTPQEYPCFGSSDYRAPALHGRSASGHSGFVLR